MAELPGWDRDRLRTASPADREAAAILVYARARRPEIRRDIAGDIAQLERSEMKPRERDVAEKRLRHRAIQDLRAAQRQQADLREVLELDVEDDD